MHTSHMALPCETPSGAHLMINPNGPSKHHNPPPLLLPFSLFSHDNPKTKTPICHRSHGVRTDPMVWTVGLSVKFFSSKKPLKLFVGCKSRG